MRIEKCDICACIVTYSDRRDFLLKSIESLAANGVPNVIVLFNGVPYETEAFCRGVEEKLKTKISFASLPRNAGSAGGYSTAIAEALKDPGVKSLLLLDDDNDVEPGGVDALLKVHCQDAPQEGAATLGYRVDRRAYRSVMTSQQRVFPFGVGGSYAGIDVRSWMARRLLSVSKGPHMKSVDSVPYCCYGGLLIDRAIVENIGLPDHTYFLYNDDHEWTYRITSAGMSIRIAPECRIRDLERSWAESDETGSVFRNLKASSREDFLYLTIRNRLWFERKLRGKSPAMRLVNFIAFNILAVSACITNPKRLKVILLAQLHGIGR